MPLGETGTFLGAYFDFFVLITLIALFELMLEFSSYACGGISYIWNDVVHIEVERHLTLMFIYTPTSSLRRN